MSGSASSLLLDGVVHAKLGRRVGLGTLIGIGAMLLGRWVIGSRCIIAAGTAYVGSIDGSLYAVDLATGQRKWKFETGGPIYSSPAVDDATIYFGSRDGHLYAVNAEDGKQKWKYDAEAPIYSSPAVAEGMVFVGVMSDFLLGVDSATGEEILQHH